MLVLHHDVTSAASAVAVLRLQPLADAGGRIAFSGIDVLGLAISIPPTRELLAEREHHAGSAVALGLELRRPSQQPPTLACHLVGDLAEERGLGAAWRLASLRAFWTDDRDIGDRTELLRLADEVGLDPEEVAARLDDRSAAQDLRSRMVAQRQRGIGGVPVLEVDGAFVPADLTDTDLEQLAFGGTR